MDIDRNRQRPQKEARHALFSDGRLLLGERLRERPVLGFDFDGTLAPIAADPDAVAIPGSTFALLERLAKRHPVVVVSGRARADVQARLAGLPLAEVVGNHGSEPFLALEPLAAEVRRWRPLVEARLAHLAGVRIEDKGSTLSIHYRNVASRHEALTTALEAIAQLGVGRIIHGKCVLNLLPKGALHKGEGLCQAMRRLERRHALYVGDDDTDEDVFRLPAAAVLGIRIEPRPGSQAPLYLSAQPEIDALLAFLLSVGEAG